jgi:hypothetical protein
LVALRGYELISSILLKYNEKPGSSSKKENFANFGFLSSDAAILAIVKLAETGDSSAEFSDLLTQLKSFVSESIKSRNYDKSSRYAALVTLYQLDPKLIDDVYRDDAQLKDSKTEGTMEYAILHAPQIVKEIFISDDRFVISMFGKIYTPAEAAKFFKNFKPSHPLPEGYILVVDEGQPPGGKKGYIWGILNRSFYLGSFFMVDDPNRAKYLIYVRP